MTSDLANTMVKEEETVKIALRDVKEKDADESNENVPQAVDSSSVSNAIRAAAANSSTQTRFSFYNAQEVQMEFSGGKSTDSSDPQRFTFYNADSTVDEQDHSPTNVANNFGVRQSDTEPFLDNTVNMDGGTESDRLRGRSRGNRPNLTPLITGELKSEAPATASREQLVAVDNLPGLGAALSSGSTDDILRSLQETEEQRMQLLKSMAPIDDKNIANTKSSRRSVSSQGSGKTPSTRDREYIECSLTAGPAIKGGSANSASTDESNPYEDAIKEALDLLRRHRSPPGTPHISSVQDLPESVAVASENPPSGEMALLSPKSRARRQQTPRENDRVLQARWDDDDDIVLDTSEKNFVGHDAVVSYEEAKLKAKQRQERMAQYASRLQEFKSSAGLSSSQSSKPVTPSTSFLPMQQPLATPSTVVLAKSEDLDSDNLGDSPVRHVGVTDESVGLSDISQSTRQRDDEIQRGVERVLLAILERANNSRGRASQESSVSRQQPPAEEPMEHIQTHMSEDSLIRAMEELLGQVSSEIPSEPSITEVTPSPDVIIGTGESSENNGLHLLSQTIVDQSSISTGMSSRRLAEKSVVDELLAEVEEEDPEFNILQQCVSPSSTAAVGRNWHTHREEKKLPDSSEAFHRLNPQIKGSASAFSSSHDAQQILQNMGGSSSNDPANSNMDGSGEDDYNPEIDEDIHDEGDGETNEDDGSYADVEDDATHDGNDEALDRVLGPLSKKAGGTTGVVLDLQNSPGNEDEEGSSLLESFSNVMKEAETVISYVTSAISPQRSDDKRDQRLVEDKYSVDEDEKHDDDVDDEAVELMRTLCAHLLPFGVDQSNQLLDSIPAWDESNPNEAGYRIIRLSKSQLRRVESAFEAMINGLKRDSERQLNKLEATSANGYDATFERELQEAEKLLDDEEHRVKVVEAQKQRQYQGTKKQTDKRQLQPGALSLSDDEHPDSSEIEPVKCHPDFPGVKSAGGGEMGDFEYFHLPIIFKSHVTGFEPTKDLVLEPGNVVAGQYLVESELGSAAFSTAYRCIDLSSDNGDDDVSVSGGFVCFS